MGLKRSEILLSLCLLIFSISYVFATGLTITPSNAIINKTHGANTNVLFNITNTEGFVFYNLTIENNNYITFNFPSQIGSGQTLIINASIISNENINKKLRIKGSYYSNVGQQYLTKEVNVSSYSSTLNPCDMTLIKGDVLRINNKLNNQIVVKDVINNIEVATIQNGNSFSIPFNAPTTFKYSVYISGFQLSDVCTITVVDSQGYINDPNLDAFLNLTTFINYNPTILNYTLLTPNFSMNFYDTKEGILSITNTGSQTAVGVHLVGEWMTFNSNNFNLNPGETKGVIFQISPIIYSSNDTNKTHVKNININGNFPSLSIPVGLFINYAAFNSNDTNQDIQDFINVFCPTHPNSILCNGTGEKVIYKYINNNSDVQFNVSYSASQVRDLWIYQLQKDDERITFENYAKGVLSNMSDSTQNTENRVISTDVKYDDLKKQLDSSQNNMLLTLIIFFLFLVCAIVGTLIYFYRKNAILNKFRTMDGSYG